jgi:para-nitrobenzyl esterase
MHKLKRFAFLLVLAVLASCQKDDTPVEEPGTRYMDGVFNEVEVQTVTYSQVNNLEMDIYQPAGDTAGNRPVVILAHGGGFINGFRNNPAMVEMGNTLAKRGYVAMSFSYRLAPGFLQLFDSLVAADVVVKAIGDARAAVRYVRKSVDEGNPYAIDPDRIFIGGNSAGAVLALTLGFLDSTDAIPPYINTILQANGGFNGNSGNAGYSSEVKAVFNLAGGLSRTGWIDANDVPSIHFHGVDDDVIPYACGDVFAGFTNGADVIDLCGSKSVHEAALAQRLTSTLYPYPGLHVPWMNSTTGETNALFDEVEQHVYTFLFEQL